MPDDTMSAEAQASPISAGEAHSGAITATKEPPAWLALPDEELLQLMLDSREDVDNQQKLVAARKAVIDEMEQALIQRLDERKAKRMPHADFDIEVETRRGDPTVCGPELFRDLNDLAKVGKVDQEAVDAVVHWETPEPQLVVNRRIGDMNRLKAFGDEVLAILDKWIRPAPVKSKRLKIEAKKKPQKNITPPSGEGSLPDYDG